MGKGSTAASCGFIDRPWCPRRVSGSGRWFLCRQVEGFAVRRVERHARANRRVAGRNKERSDDPRSRKGRTNFSAAVSQYRPHASRNALTALTNCSAW